MSIALAGPAASSSKGPAVSNASATPSKFPLQPFAATLQATAGQSAAVPLPSALDPTTAALSDSATTMSAFPAGLSPLPPPVPAAAASPDPSGADAVSAAATRPRRDPRRDGDPLDPMARHAAQIGSPQSLAFSTPATQGASDPQVRARASLEEVLPGLVRRVAWSGDGRRATMRLEIGAGHMAGATLLVHADDGRVRVELSAPAGVDAASWRERILARLHLRGVCVDSVQVD